MYRFREILLLLCWLSSLRTIVGSSLRGLQSKNGRLKKLLGNNRLVDQNGSDLESEINIDQCGLDVSIDGTIAVVGCPGSDGGVGSVQVYDLKKNTWKLSTTLRPSAGSILGFFGSNVAIRNAVIVVGSFTNSAKEFGAGGAFVFEKVLGVWTETASLSLDEPMQGDQFGRDVAISEDGRTIAIGATLADSRNVPDSGTVAIFQKIENEWRKQGILQPENPETLSSFGASLGLYGRTLVVGAFGRTVDDNTAQGEILVFEELTKGNFTQTAVLRADDGASFDSFGTAVDIHLDRIVVGAAGDDNDKSSDTGSAYVFERQEATSNWKQVAKLKPTAISPLHGFGGSVAVSKHQIAIGAVGADDFQTDAGAVYVFEDTIGTFQEVSVLGTNNNLLVGVSVGFSGTDLIVGAPGGIRGSAFVESKTTLAKCLPQVTGFEVTDVKNAKTSPIDFAVNLQGLGGLINVRAKVDSCGQPSAFQCARLELDSTVRLQRSEPFHLFPFTGGVPETGFGLLRACLFDDPYCKIGRKGCLDVDTVVLECTPSIEGFVLYDATTDKPLDSISNGKSICLPPGGMINIMAVANCVDFIEFAFRGADGRADDRVESTAPYFLYGDSGSDIKPQYDEKPMQPGVYAVRARFRTGNPHLGRRAELVQRFALIDCTTEQPSFQSSLSPSASPLLQNVDIGNAPVTNVPTHHPSTATVSPMTSAPTTPSPLTVMPTVLTSAPSPVPTTPPKASTISPTTTSPSAMETDMTTSSPIKSPTNAPTSLVTTLSPTTTNVRVTLSPSLSPTTSAPTTISPTMNPTTSSPVIVPSTLSPTTASPTVISLLPSSNPTESPIPAVPRATEPVKMPPVLSDPDDDDDDDATEDYTLPTIPTSAPTTISPTMNPTTSSPVIVPSTLSPTTASPTVISLLPSSNPTVSPTPAVPRATEPVKMPTTIPPPSIGGGVPLGVFGPNMDG